MRKLPVPVLLTYERDPAYPHEPEVHKQVVVNLGDLRVEVDERMADLLVHVNNVKGWKTQHSCQGHSTFMDMSVDYAYVSFARTEDALAFFHAVRDAVRCLIWEAGTRTETVRFPGWEIDKVLEAVKATGEK